jgi:excisionase family DNA binding protein
VVKSLLSVREVASVLGIGYKTAYRLVRSGDIPAMKVGGMYRVRSNDLENYLNQSRIVSHSKDSSEEIENTVEGPVVETCGLCSRVISVPANAQSCTSANCTKLICGVCANSDECCCSEHKLSADELLDKARDEVAKGKLDFLVTSEVAEAQCETFFNNIRDRVIECKTLDFPMMKLEANGPFEFHDNRDQIEKRFVIELNNIYGKNLLVSSWIIRSVSMMRKGFDTKPLDLTHYKKAVGTLRQQSNREDTPILAILVSPTGWSQESLETSMLSLKVSPKTNKLDQGLYTILFDTRLGKVLGELPDDYKDLNRLLTTESATALVERIRSFVDDWFLLRDGVTVFQANEQLGMDESVIREVFEELAETGSYHFDEIKGAGKVLYPHID